MDENIWEVSNVYRTDLSRMRLFKKNKRAKQSLELQANGLCKDFLTERYIHNAFGKFDSGYIYSREEETIGFCLWKVYKDNSLHILLLCSRYPNYGLGKTMIQDIEYYCSENKISTISVEPASEILFDYYGKFGFILDEKDHTRMIKTISLLEIRRITKTRKSHAEKRHFPMTASMMPIDMNVWRNNSA
jgi:hypothetical protein